MTCQQDSPTWRERQLEERCQEYEEALLQSEWRAEALDSTLWEVRSSMEELGAEADRTCQELQAELEAREATLELKQSELDVVSQQLEVFAHAEVTLRWELRETGNCEEERMQLAAEARTLKEEARHFRELQEQAWPQTSRRYEELASEVASAQRTLAMRSAPPPPPPTLPLLHEQQEQQQQGLMGLRQQDQQQPSQMSLRASTCSTASIAAAPRGSSPRSTVASPRQLLPHPQPPASHLQGSLCRVAAARTETWVTGQCGGSCSAVCGPVAAGAAASAEQHAPAADWRACAAERPAPLERPAPAAVVAGEALRRTPKGARLAPAEDLLGGEVFRQTQQTPRAAEAQQTPRTVEQPDPRLLALEAGNARLRALQQSMKLRSSTGEATPMPMTLPGSATPSLSMAASAPVIGAAAATMPVATAPALMGAAVQVPRVLSVSTSSGGPLLQPSRTPMTPLTFACARRGAN